MIISKIKWGISLVVIACAGCCALPLLAVFATGSAFSAFAIIFKENSGDMLLCSLLLVLLWVGYRYYTKGSLKKCCASPKRECDNTKCSGNLP